MHASPICPIALLMLATATGCLGGSGDSDGSGSGSGPTHQCEVLIDVICDRLVDCSLEISGEAAPTDGRAQCTTALRNDLACGKAVSIGQSYPECISLLQSNPCRTLFPGSANPELDLPADCHRVVLLE